LKIAVEIEDAVTRDLGVQVADRGKPPASHAGMLRNPLAADQIEGHPALQLGPQQLQALRPDQVALLGF
jgi:hypothetical protein